MRSNSKRVVYLITVIGLALIVLISMIIRLEFLKSETVDVSGFSEISDQLLQISEAVASNEVSSLSPESCFSIPEISSSIIPVSGTNSSKTDSKPSSMISSSSAEVNRVDDVVSQEVRYEDVIADPDHSREELIRTAEYFIERSTNLEESLKSEKYFAKTIRLDDMTKTNAYVYAKNEVYADSLNGFFYYLIDETVSTSCLSPVVLCVSTLFDEPQRQTVIGNRSYAEPLILDKLEGSLKALLGELYRDEVLDFIYDNYKMLFDTRLGGGSVPICFYKLSVPGLEVYFRNAFMTYIEFYVK